MMQAPEEKAIFFSRRRAAAIPSSVKYHFLFGHFDTAQKKIKAIGGKDFEWQTELLDLFAELTLLEEYGLRARREAGTYFYDDDVKRSQKDKEFYGALSEELAIDFKEPCEERDVLCERHNKIPADRHAFYSFIDEIGHNEGTRLRGADEGSSSYGA